MAKMKQLSRPNDDVEVLFTMYLLGTSITRPLQDKSWPNIIEFVNANLNNKVEVEIHFKLKS
jgi:hypothetical protein